MEASAVSNEVVDRANELYWGSDESVNQIAEELDLSKGALYAMVEPHPAGVGCPLCGAEVGFANRTAKDRGRLDCSVCDWDGTRDEAAEIVEETVEEPDIRELPVPARVPPPPDRSMRSVAGGALIGAAIGLALVFWARRR